MINKNFKGWLNENGNQNLIKQFNDSIKKLNDQKQVKINTEIENHSHLLYMFLHEIIGYKNLIYFRLYDLSSSLIPLIEVKNYTSAVLICRALFETNAMYAFRMERLTKLIFNKKWRELYVEILNFRMLPSWKEDGDINWEKVFPGLKKFHINDAIRCLSLAGENKKEVDFLEKELFTHYAKMSEICHPNQANRQLYVFDRDKIDLEKRNKRVFRDNFSVNHADKTVFPIFENTMNGFLSLDKFANGIFINIMDSIIKNKTELELYDKSSKSKDDMFKVQPILEEIKTLTDKGYSPKEMVDEIMKKSYKIKK